MVVFLLLVIIAILAPGLAVLFAVGIGSVIATVIPCILFGFAVVLIWLLAKKLGITISKIKDKIQTWHIIVVLIAIIAVFVAVVIVPNIISCHVCKKLAFKNNFSYIYSVDDDAKYCGDCALEYGVCEYCGYKFDELYRFWFNYRNEEIIERFVCKADAEESDRTCGWPEHGIELYVKK